MATENYVNPEVVTMFQREIPLLLEVLKWAAKAESEANVGSHSKEE